MTRNERERLATVAARDLKLARSRRSLGGGCSSCTELLGDVVNRGLQDKEVLSPLETVSEGSSASFRAPDAGGAVSPSSLIEALLVNSVKRAQSSILDVFSRALSSGGGAGGAGGAAVSPGCCALHARPSASLLAEYWRANGEQSESPGNFLAMPALLFIRALDLYLKSVDMCKGACREPPDARSARAHSQQLRVTGRQLSP